MPVGVLALQGDFAEHLSMLSSLGIAAHAVRTGDDLARCDRLILPGGESTVMSMLLRYTSLDREIIRRVRREAFPVFGTCAGAILLAEKVTGDHPVHTLGLLAVTIERNAFGTHAQSSLAQIPFEGKSVAASFIRAPRIIACDSGVEVLARNEKDPVLVRQGSVLAATFHSEVHGADAIHRFFLAM